MEHRSQATSVFQCPTCNMEIQNESQMKKHLNFEIEDLKNIHNDVLDDSSQDQQQRKPYSVFQRVQRNRQSRLKQRTRKRSSPPAPTPAEHACPICNVHYPPNQIQRHAEQCLRKSNGISNGHSSNEDDDGEEGCEEYEEYEWAGQKRIRASSLLEGGYASIGIGQCTSNRNGEDDEDEDLNVDEDDTTIYGPAQYNEADVIPTKMLRNGESAPHTDNVTDEEDVTNYMRSLITAGATKFSGQLDKNATEIDTSLEPESHSLNCHPSSSATAAVAPATSTSTSTLLSTKSPSEQTATHYQQIIDSLKMKLRQYENHVPSKYKCLICLDDYKNPAISVSCWHVHCEECWLRSLGARKLCPQCNLITTPKDLRRIYM